MPDSSPVAAIPAGDAAAADAVRAAASALAPGADPETLRTATGVLALAVRDLPELFRRLSGRSGDACTAGRPTPAAGSFWFQMETAAEAADRLRLALDTAHASLHEGGEDR